MGSGARNPTRPYACVTLWSDCCCSGGAAGAAVSQVRRRLPLRVWEFQKRSASFRGPPKLEDSKPYLQGLASSETAICTATSAAVQPAFELQGAVLSIFGSRLWRRGCRHGTFVAIVGTKVLRISTSSNRGPSGVCAIETSPMRAHTFSYTDTDT